MDHVETKEGEEEGKKLDKEDEDLIAKIKQAVFDLFPSSRFEAQSRTAFTKAQLDTLMKNNVDILTGAEYIIARNCSDKNRFFVTCLVDAACVGSQIELKWCMQFILPSFVTISHHDQQKIIDTDARQIEDAFVTVNACAPNSALVSLNLIVRTPQAQRLFELLNPPAVLAPVITQKPVQPKQGWIGFVTSSIASAIYPANKRRKVTESIDSS